MSASDTHQQSVEHIGRALSTALQHADPSLTIRLERAEDAETLCHLYQEFRWHELMHVPWPEAAKMAFLAEQFRLQADHYRKHYDCARFWVVCHESKVIGRLYLHRSPSEFRLMDIMLFERCRGKGFGRVMIDCLLTECQALCLPISLHVERENPARDFYLRRGFELDEDRGTYLFMVWRPMIVAAATD
ncbi:GNAT family N-acetyltransferase [Ahniella affigens]|nr:GNAT family N-acetyltransferase [Ahniella affigens]